MITKYSYKLNAAGLVERTHKYSFTAIEDLSARLFGVDNVDVINGITQRTLNGEAERHLIEQEDKWFKIQTTIQQMDAERVDLEIKLTKGDRFGNPLTTEVKNGILARIAELKEGTVTIKKVFYNHYTRQNMEVDEVIQTPYTVVRLTRDDLEAGNPYLAGLRGVTTAPARPEPKLSAARETEIRKELVRQKIFAQVGDVQDLLADVSNALSSIIKKVSGQTLTTTEETSIAKYVGRQEMVNTILATDYIKK